MVWEMSDSEKFPPTKTQKPDGRKTRENGVKYRNYSAWRHPPVSSTQKSREGKLQGLIGKLCLYRKKLSLLASHAWCKFATLSPQKNLNNSYFASFFHIHEPFPLFQTEQRRERCAADKNVFSHKLDTTMCVVENGRSLRAGNDAFLSSKSYMMIQRDGKCAFRLLFHHHSQTQ